MAQPQPFRFDDFNACASAPQAAEEPASRANEAELDAARLDGVKEGRRLAMESIAADEMKILAEIGARLASDSEELGRARAATRDSLVATAGLFLDAFCGALAMEREVEAGVDLLRRLLDHSDDRRPARLVVSAKSLERINERLERAIAAAGAADFVTLAGDPALAAGDVRIEWRGGEARRTKPEIEAAVAALMNSFTHAEEPRT